MFVRPQTIVFDFKLHEIYLYNRSKVIAEHNINVLRHSCFTVTDSSLYVTDINTKNLTVLLHYFEFSLQ